MKKIILLFILLGIFSFFASCSTNTFMTKIDRDTVILNKRVTFPFAWLPLLTFDELYMCNLSLECEKRGITTAY